MPILVFVHIFPLDSTNVDRPIEAEKVQLQPCAL